MRGLPVALLAHALVLACPALTFAQAALPDLRGFASLSIGFQGATKDFSQTVTFEEFVEEGTIDTDYAIDAAPFFEAGGGFVIARNLGAGVTVSRYATDHAAPVEARLPHPFRFNQFRIVTGEAGSLERNETGIHVQAFYALPLSDSLRLLLSGGPSFFHVAQDLVGAVEYTSSFPFDTASFTSAVITRDSATAVGFNVGAELMVRMTGLLGAGGGVRFTRGSADLTASEGNGVSVDVGGVQLAAGVRLLF